jgi:stage V sporulation protein D (sporulation-specific penicillin-binding protein)
MSAPVSQSETSRRELKRRTPRSPLWRLRAWQLLLFLIMLCICARLYYLQIMRGGDLTRRATVQRKQNNLLIHRGAITDRHGLPLAIDTTRYDIFVHPALLKVDTAEAVDTFARITHADSKRLERLFSSDFPVITVARHLGREEVDELQALNWAGIDIVPRSFRHYPEAKLASHILGYVNLDTLGQGGVEQAENGLLENIGDVSPPQLDGHGHPIMVAKEPELDITPPMGRHVELTVDNYLQHLAEKELSAECIHSHALRGTAIVTDPQTGEILAWANYPTYDPNQYSKYPYEVTKNWAMVDVYQPGSTFKILTLSSALEEGVIKPTIRLPDNGFLKVGNRVIRNHEPGGNGMLDLLHLLIHSSNVASAEVGLMMTPKQFHDKLHDFGLGRPTGIELSGESAGLLSPAKVWQPIDQATTAFGQGAMAVTPLQLVAAVGAVANNGMYVQPHLIRRIYDPRTGVTERWTQPLKRRVVSAETARLVCNLLADNVEQGTQLAGKVPGYRVAGKTGTAQKPSPGGRGYLSGVTIASFIGFLPVDNPHLLCLVVVDSPHTAGGWGNTVAGPVFDAIAMEAARYLGIPPAHVVDVSNKKSGSKFIAPSVEYANELPLEKDTPSDTATH